MLVHCSGKKAEPCPCNGNCHGNFFLAQTTAGATLVTDKLQQAGRDPKIHLLKSVPGFKLPALPSKDRLRLE